MRRSLRIRLFWAIPLAALALALPARAAEREAAVQVDGRLLRASAYVEDGVTYAPLRTLLSALGEDWSVWWDAGAGQAAARSARRTLQADPAAGTLSVDGSTYSGQIRVKQGVTYVPLRLLCQALDCAVEWDPYLDGAAVTTPQAAFSAVDLYWLARIIYAESGAEPMAGQIAVGSVVLNRVESPAFPNTVREVIFDRKDAVQFEPVANGRVFLAPSSLSMEAARRALAGEKPVGGATHFYAPALSPGTWINENCVYQTSIGCHRFYMED